MTVQSDSDYLQVHRSDFDQEEFNHGAPTSQPSVNGSDEQVTLCTRLSHESLNRLRKIVERQKTELLHDQLTNCHNGHEFRSFQDSHFPAEPSDRPLLRKVTDGLLPPTYFGFSFSQTNDLRLANEFDPSWIGYRQKSSTVRQKHVLEKTNSHTVKRIVSQTHEAHQCIQKSADYGPGSWRVGQELIRRHFGIKRSSGSAESDREENILSAKRSFEKVDQLLPPSVNDAGPIKLGSTPDVEHPASLVPKTASIGAKKGLYRRDRRLTEQTKQGTSLDTGSVCNRKRSNVSRADLQALVRKQREMRREERRKKEQAEAERRERIQRNLSATALAAATAAKAPTTPKGKKRRTASGECFETDAGISVEHLPISARSVALQQKLKELLGTDDDNHKRRGSVTGPPSDIFVKDKNQGKPSGFKPVSSIELSGGYTEAPDKSFRSEDRPIPKPQTTSVEHLLAREFQFRNDPPRAFPADEVTRRNQFEGSPQAIPEFGRPQLRSDSYSNYPCTRELEQKADTDGCLVSPDADTNVPLVLDTDNLTARDIASTSSCGDTSPYGPARWVRLEAVGASEPELAIEDEEKGEFIDDMKPEVLPQQNMGRTTLRTSDNVILPLGDNTCEHSTHRPYDEVKRLIYSDPLRFSVVRKHQQAREVERTRPIGDRKSPQGTVVADPCARPSDLFEDTQRSSSLSLHDTSEPPIDVEHPVVHPSKISYTTENTSFGAMEPGFSSPESQTRHQFILHATEQAVSSTPRHENTTTAQKPIANGPGTTIASMPPPRLTAAALSLQLSAEMNQLEALTSSIQHIAEMESLRQFAVAQAETVGLAQLLKTRQTDPDATLIPASTEQPTRPVEQRSQYTSVTPDLALGKRSPHYESVLRAAEEFHKVERRLTEHRTELRSSRRTEDVSAGSTSSVPSKTSSRKLSVKQTTTFSSSIRVKDGTESKSEHSSATQDRSVRNKTTASEISTDMSGSVSARESTQSVAMEAVSAVDDSSAVHSVRTQPQTTLTDSRTVSHITPARSSYSSKTSRKVSQVRESSSSTPPPPADHKRSPKHRKSRPIEKPRPPEDSSVTVNSGALALVDSVLAERAAVLKARKEKAQRLLKISRTLEKEEDEVVRLERTALKAAQAKRRQLRSSHIETAPGSSSVDHPKESSSSKQVSYSSDFAPSINTGRSGSQRPSAQGAATEPMLSIREASSLSQADLSESISKHKSNGSSSNTLSATERQLSIIPSPQPRDRSKHSSQAKSVSTAACMLTGSRASSIGKLHPSIQSAENVLEAASSRSSTRPSVSTDKPREPSGEHRLRSAIASPPALPKPITTEVLSSSSDRATPPTPHSRHRSPLVLPGRRSRHSSSTLSGPYSAESMDDECGTCSEAMDPDDQFSQVDLSVMESRIQALHSNLLKQERLLSRINKLKKHESKDRLSRLQSTLVQHKQLCTNIIHNIKTQLDACQSSLRLEPSVCSARDTSSIASKSHSSMLLDLSKLDKLTENRRLPSVEAIEPEAHATPVASLADEAVCATDTEGDLQKLEFDDKSEQSDVRSIADEQNYSVHSGQDEETASGSEATLVSNSEQVSSVASPHIKPRSSVREVCTENIPSNASATDEAASCILEISDRLTDVDFENETFSRTLTYAGEKSGSLRMPVSEKLAQPSVDDSLTPLQPPMRGTAITVATEDRHTLLNVTETVPTSDAIFVEVEIAPKPLTRSPSVKIGAVSAMGRGEGTVEHLAEPSSEVGRATTDQLTTPAAKALLADEVTDELFTRILSDTIDSAISLSKAKKGLSAESRSKASPLNDVTVKFTEETEPVATRITPDDAEEFWDQECSSESPEGEDYSAAISQDHLFTEENLRGLVADIPTHTSPLISEAVRFLWNARQSAESGIREAALLNAVSSPPEIFQSHWTDPRDLDPELHSLPYLRFVNRGLLFDLAAEFVQRIYSGEDAEYEAKRQQLNPKPRITSAQFRLWKGPTRPSTYEALLPLVESYIGQELQLRSSVTGVPTPDDTTKPSATMHGRMNLSRLVQWTLSKKPRLDRLIELDLRADEGSWLAYGPEEMRLKHKLADDVWNELLHDALDSMLRCSRRTSNQNSPPNSTEVSAAAS